MSNIYETQKKFYEIEIEFEWDKWMKKIPAIKFPSDWYVKIIPPFNGAMIRFRVGLDKNGDTISVYLDCYGCLGGIAGHPYWEIYPAAGGDIARFELTDVKGLLEGIEEALEGMK